MDPLTSPGETPSPLSIPPDAAAVDQGVERARSGRGRRSRRPERTRGVGASLLHGASWNTAAEVAPVIINITLTPYLIHGLGIERYGIYALAATITVFLNSFDGGLAEAALRFFGVNAGRGDQVANTRLLCSLSLIVLAGGGVISAADWFASPWLAEAFSLPARYRADAVVLLRTFGLLVTISLLLGLFTSLMQAHGRFGVTSKVRVASYLAWAVGLYLTVAWHDGLRGVALALIAEQVAVAVFVVPASLRHLTLRSAGLMSRSELWGVLRFGGNIQIRGITQLVNLQLNALIIGATLPVRDVGLYNAGANPATQLFYVAVAAGAPLAAYLSRIFGESGEGAARSEMAKAQRLWVMAISGIMAAAVAAAYFAVRAWLGHQFTVSAWTAVLLLGGYGFALLTAVLSFFASAIGRQRLQVRPSVVGMIVNVVLTVPAAFFGVLPVVAATVVGQVVAGLYMLRCARREIGRELPSYLREVPVVRALVCAGVTVALELVMAPIVPSGPLGLILCGIPALIALSAYVVTVLGVRRVATTLKSIVGERSLRPARTVLPFA